MKSDEHLYDHRAILLLISCRTLASAWNDVTVLVSPGMRFDLWTTCCGAQGTFISQVQRCDPPLAAHAVGELELAVAVPVDHLHHFEAGIDVELRKATTPVARGTVLEVKAI